MKDMKFAKYDDRGQGFKLYVTCESNDRFFLFVAQNYFFNKIAWCLRPWHFDFVQP